MADSFKNCSGFTDGELKGLALYRGITSIILCVSLFIMLVSILISAKCCCFRTLCGTFLKRFAIGLTAVSMLCLLFYAMQMNNFVDLQDQKFCEAVGFLVMYTGSVQLLLTVGTSLVFFIKVWKALTFVTLLDTLCRRCENQTFTCRGLKVNILEIVFYVSVVGIPLLLDWIPFITNSYGPTVAWCWIRKYESDCSTHIAGLVEGLLFWDAPYFIVAILIIGLLIISLVQLCIYQRKFGCYKLLDVGAFDLLVFQIFSFILFLLHVVVLCYYFSYQYKERLFDLWVFESIAYPFAVIIVPVILLGAIHSPLSKLIICMLRNQKQGVDDQPSRTTWKCPHEPFESDTTHLINEQQPEAYGTNA